MSWHQKNNTVYEKWSFFLFAQKKFAQDHEHVRSAAQ